MGPRFTIALTAAAALLFAHSALAESEFTKKFLEANDTNDPLKTLAVVEGARDKVPGEIKALLDEAARPETSKEQREETLYVAELIAKVYKDSTGEIGPLKEVKKAVFNSRLPEATRPKGDSGLHVVELPMETEHAKNVFSPANIIIKKGDTVRWINRDKIAHLFASMPVIGMGGLRTPNIEPNGSWEYKFEKPGEYYYICFIHQGMVGKVTVEDTAAPAAPAPTQAAPTTPAAPVAAPQPAPAQTPAAPANGNAAPSKK